MLHKKWRKLKTMLTQRRSYGSDNAAIATMQCYKATMQLKEVVFAEEEFLYKKISKKDVYVHCGAMAVIPQVAVKQYGDLTALK